MEKPSGGIGSSRKPVLATFTQLQEIAQSLNVRLIDMCAS